MKIMGLGVDFNGTPLFEPIDENRAAKALVSALERNVESVRSLVKTISEARSFGEMERKTIDAGDPISAGWTFLVNSSDPHSKEIQKILEPLAKHRGMADPKKPLLYNSESSDEWIDWIQDNYYAPGLEGQKVPQYILIAGDPDQVPFRFQSLLGTISNVGRVAFDTPDDLKNYIDKLIRLETADEPVVSRQAILFAPDGGLLDPTYYSRKYMVAPLVEHIRETFGLEAHSIQGEEATKMNLLNVLSTRKPALVYTASHGLGATKEPFEIQKKFNGAICCQHTGALTLEGLFAADDVPLDQPFLEGTIFFQFACFGYGTPAESDYAHWLNEVPKQYTDADFVAALPKKLLAHPRGPVAFIGHLDTAFLHAFADTEELDILDRWHTRIFPFVNTVNRLLQVQPSGLAMTDMNAKYNMCNAMITNTYDRLRRGKLIWNDRLEKKFLDNWIVRGDAQNYMIFGDPAVRLRIPAN